MRLLLLLGLLTAVTTASAQVYRWVDEKGNVTYSNATPPAGVKSKVVDPDAKAGPPSPESLECYTMRGQGERLEQRIARRDEFDARLAAERAAATPPRPRGLDFRKYISIQRGMSEGELVTVAGAPDTVFYDPFYGKNYTYFPTSADPFTTTVTVIWGRVHGVERVRKF